MHNVVNSCLEDAIGQTLSMDDTSTSESVKLLTSARQMLVNTVGKTDGCALGCREGFPDGCEEGCKEGLFEGWQLGFRVGLENGWLVGAPNGCTVGELVG